MYKSLTLLYVLNVDVVPMRPDGNTRTFMWPVQGGDDSLLHVIEGKMVRITQYVPTLRMDHIPMIMQEYVVGVPSTWLCLLRRVDRIVLHYRRL